MPYKEKTIERSYYSIGEVADMMGVSVSLLRYWEKEFDALRPKKNRRGERFFTPSDLETIRLIFHLTRDQGYTLDGAKQRLKHGGTADLNKHTEVIEKLKHLRAFLAEIREQI